MSYYLKREAQVSGAGVSPAPPNQALRIDHSAVKCRTTDPLTRVVLRNAVYVPAATRAIMATTRVNLE
jgi:hypothetical protein